MENGIGKPYSKDLKSAVKRYNKEMYPDELVSGQLDIRDAVEIIERYMDTYGDITDELYQQANDTCIAWIKAELHDKSQTKYK